MTLRAAVIGCGRAGAIYQDRRRSTNIANHAAAYSACDGVELAAICDADPVRLQQAACLWPAPARYADPAAMLSAVRPDIVSVCTPDGTHARILRQLLEGPVSRAVIVEKPLVLDPAEGQELVAAFRSRGTTLAVAYMRRFAPAFAELRRTVQSAGFGNLEYLRGLYVNGLRHNGTHWIDLARFLCGEITSVKARPDALGCDDDPAIDVDLHFASGLTANLHGLSRPGFSLFELDLFGASGRVRVSDSGYRIHECGVAPSGRFEGYNEYARHGRIQVNALDSAFLWMVEDVVKAAHSGGNAACTGEDGVMALRIAAAARESLRGGGRTVAIAPINPNAG